MIPDNVRFFASVEPGQTLKQDWSEAYTSPTPVAYRDQLMVACRIHAKDGILKEIVDHEILDPLMAAAGKGPLFCVDLLSSYGDSFLAAVHGMHPEEILEAWSSDEKSLTAIKPRRFPCRTLGVDLSGPALAYAERAGIFDETMRVDVNAMDQADSDRLTGALARAGFVHLGAPGYIGLETFDRLIDAFASGEKPGYLAVAFNYLFMTNHKAFKKCIVEKLDFINCVGGVQRFLTPEETAFFGVGCAYSTTWVMGRPL